MTSASAAPQPTPTGVPEEHGHTLRRARRLEVISLVFTAAAAALVFAVMGNSQAMKVAWVEDALSLLPPAFFLIASVFAKRPPDRDRPYGHHRAIGAAHLAAAVALLLMGVFMVVDSGLTLVFAEHPTIGTIRLFGQTVWLGWVMMAVMIGTGLPTIVLGRLKMKLAEPLHDKVLFADADMNKADWTTALGAVLGILGIGLGVWWADSVVAMVIAASIVRDGVKNLRGAVGDLLDRQARSYDDEREHPLVRATTAYFEGLPWVESVAVRIRDLGHVFHSEVFVVPRPTATLDDLEDGRAGACALDWKLRDLVVIPVRLLPAWQFRAHGRQSK